MPIALNEVLETVRMITAQNLDIRTVTLGLSLADCAGPDPDTVAECIYQKVVRSARNLVEAAQEAEAKFGIPIVNKRVAVSPISTVAAACQTDDYLSFAQAMDRAATEVGINFIGGFSALVHKGDTAADLKLMDAIPRALAKTERVCSSVNLATTRTGINMDAVYRMAKKIKEAAALTAERDGLGCAKLVVFANAPEDNPFMAGAFHGAGEPEMTINVGVSGPGVVRAVVEQLGDLDLGALAEEIKKTAFKITRVGELVGREVSERLGIPFGIVDLSLAPTPAPGDSVARILEAMGLERCGAPGTTAALALLNEAVKKGGAFASSYVGGLSGAFIPVSEDDGMMEAAAMGALTLEKLEAMTCVCSVGLDMVAVPGDVTAETLAGIIADEMAIGVINNKTTAVRIIPVPGKKAGDWAEFGGLLGRAPVMSVNRHKPDQFIQRGGRIPAPLRSLTN